jgi:hypothetical protein
MDEGKENNKCADEGGLPLIKKSIIWYPYRKRGKQAKGNANG